MSSDANIFRREGEYWTIVYEGQTCRLRDVQGLRVLARLLQEPGNSIPATALAATRRAQAPAGSTPDAPDREPDPAEAEHARLNVTRAIKAAVAKVAVHMPMLGDHLRATIRTGGRCLYVPDPRVPIRWNADQTVSGDRASVPQPSPTN